MGKKKGQKTLKNGYCPLRVDETSNYYVRLANKSKVQVIGKAPVEIRLGLETYNITVLIIKNLSKECLLGLDILSKHPEFKTIIDQLIKVTKSIHITSSKVDVNRVSLDKPIDVTHNNIETNKIIKKDQSIDDVALLSQRQIFEEKIASISSDGIKDLTPTNKIQHVIKVTDETPIRQQIRHVPYYKKEQLSLLLENMIERKFIVPSQSGWRTPLNIIMKPEKTIRITLGYKKLNNVS